MPDQYTRTRAQLGTPALDVLRRAHVAVFGIGGVGGQAVEVLARSGVGELSLFDSDTVALSNLNRQLVALHSTLGQYKVDAMAARIADIDPTIIVHANRMFYNAETAPDVDLMQFDYVLDCIDTVSAKLLLIRCCKKDGVPILCSMGAANKLDPTAFRVADIEKTTVDPLAKVIRLECRKRRLGKVKVVILGQDPYHGYGQAMGLSFSVPQGVEAPPSLKNIFKEIESDLGIRMSGSPDLRPWAEQGVLLLNSVLTVRAGQPASHSRKPAR